MSDDGILRSPWKHVPTSTKASLAKVILDRAISYRERIAYIDDASGVSVTYSQFVRDCHRLAAGLYTAGLRKGDVVAIQLENCVQYTIVWFGTILCGATAAGFFPGWTNEDVDSTLTRVMPKVLFTRAESLRAMKARGNNVEKIVEHCYIVGESYEGHTTMQELLSNDFALPDVAIDAKKDIATLVFTSGTTGGKKAVSHSHYSYLSAIPYFNGVCTENVLSVDGVDVTVTSRPFTHIYGHTLHFVVGPCRGLTCVVLGDYDAQAHLRAIEKYKITLLTSVPNELMELLKSPELSQHDVTSLNCITVAGTKSPLSMLENCRKILDVAPTNVYGSTEMGFITFNSDRSRLSSVGRLMPDYELQIVDVKSGEILGENEQGEVCLRGSQRFTDYRMGPGPALPRALAEDDWFRTADVGYYDSEGFLYLEDRISDIIHYGVYKVPPGPIEEVILQVGGVAEVGVVGYPDEMYGQLPRAYVVREEGSSVTEQEICDAVRAKLDDSRSLRGGVIFTKPLPKSGGLGKLNRAKLRQQMLAEMAKTQAKN